jgi:hypothetical protein
MVSGKGSVRDFGWNRCFWCGRAPRLRRRGWKSATALNPQEVSGGRGQSPAWVSTRSGRAELPHAERALRAFLGHAGSRRQRAGLPRTA